MFFPSKIFFNRHFRINRKGLFNVLMGSYKKLWIYDVASLRAPSDRLNGVHTIREIAGAPPISPMAELLFSFQTDFCALQLHRTVRKCFWRYPTEKSDGVF